MLKTLIKKQFTESFRKYFVNYKTGKARSKGGIVGMFILFASIMLYLCGMFFVLGMWLGKVLCPIGLSWLFLALMGMISVVLGTFGSVFNTYSALYLSKDNDTLLSMPIPPSAILVSRIVLVYGLALLYSAPVWIPGMIVYFIFGSPSALAVIFCVLLTFVIAFFVTVLTCALGWVVALISTKLKNRSFIIVLVSLALIFGYYVIYFRAANLFENFLDNAPKYAGLIKKYGSLFYQLGLAGTGDWLAMIIFVGITALLCALCLALLSKSFMKIVAKTSNVAVGKKQSGTSKAGSLKAALLKKEFKRFTSSATYLLNCGLGAVILPVIAIVALCKRGDLDAALAKIPDGAAGIGGFLPLAVAGVIALVLSMNCITTPSVSLEGSSFWILGSIPVRTLDILRAKEKVQLFVNIPPTIVSIILFAIFLRADAATILLITVFSLADIWLMAGVGLLIGIKTANFIWTNETIPIKQSVGVLFSLLIGWSVPLALAILFIALRKFISPVLFLAIASALVLIGALVIDHRLKTKGVEMFDEL